MTRRKTYEEFIKEFEELQKTNERSKSIIIKGEYEKSSAPIDVECSVCGHEWSPLVKTLLAGRGCDKCNRKSTRSNHKKFLERFEEWKVKYPHYENINIVGEYITAKAPVDVECKICGHTWELKPYRLCLGYGCQECHFERMRKHAK